MLALGRLPVARIIITSFGQGLVAIFVKNFVDDDGSDDVRRYPHCRESLHQLFRRGGFQAARGDVWRAGFLCQRPHGHNGRARARGEGFHISEKDDIQDERHREDVVNGFHGVSFIWAAGIARAA